MAELRQNTWSLDEWYGQNVAGNVTYNYGGELWAWGEGSGGQLDNNAKIDRSSPTQIGTNTTWKWLTTTHTGNGGYCIKMDNTLWSWGESGNGMLGQNEDIGYSSPMQIPGSWKMVEGGRTNVAAIKTNGELYVWGSNTYGQLGINIASGPNGRRSSPVLLPGSWENVDIGYHTMAAVKTDGTLWSWGYGLFGALGINLPGSIARSSPVQVGSSTDWKDVKCGTHIMAARKNNNQVYVCGQGTDGQLGLNQTSFYNLSQPTLIPGTWEQIDCASTDTWMGMMGVKSGGSMYVWGKAYGGQLGLGGPGWEWTKRSSPTLIPGTWDTNLDESGEQQTICVAKTMAAKRADGDWYLWGWGGNANALGLNQPMSPAPSTAIASPVQLPGSWQVIRSGDATTMAIK